tara:strand:- start:1361 stop:1540 length:180 start_codon:yes stop_codon:yes gene_type:complete
MIFYEEDKAECDSCGSLNVKSKVFLQNGDAWEIFTCQGCGHKMCEDIPLSREEIKRGKE